MGQVHTVELADLPPGSLNPEAYFDRLVTESELSLEEKELTSSPPPPPPQDKKQQQQRKSQPCLYRVLLLPPHYVLLRVCKSSPEDTKSYRESEQIR